MILKKMTLKRPLLLSAMLFCWVAAFAQKSLPNWEVEVELAPSKYQYDFEISTGDFTGYFVSGEKINGDISLQAWRKVSHKLQLGSGLRYSAKDPGIQYYCHVCSFIAAPPVEREIARYLEIPLALRFYPFKRKGLYAEAALSVQAKVAATENGDVLGLLQSRLPDFLAGIRAGLGYRIALGNAVAIHLGAGLRQDLDFSASQEASHAFYSKAAFSLAL